MAQRPTVSSTNNTLALLKANSEVVIHHHESGASNVAGIRMESPIKSDALPEENLDPATGGNDEPINLVLNSGSPNHSQLATYNSHSAVVTPFQAETTVLSAAIAEVTEDPSTN